MNISIIGTGYVGLGTVVGFSGNGHNVICIDKDHSKVDLINQGITPFFEDGFGDFLSAFSIKNGRKIASVNYRDVLTTDASYICVDTPLSPDGNIDLTNLKAAVQELGELLAWKSSFHVVIIKSTVVPGTTQQVIIPLLERCSGKIVGEDIGVAVSPEFLQEGTVMQCSLNPHRIIIGESDPRTGDLVEGIYHHLSAPIVRTDLTTAEMTKCASNAFLATKVSFINEIGNICKKLEIDVFDVTRGMGYDPRIGTQFFNAGIGFGGSCLPKDLEALIQRAEELDYETKLLKSVAEVNKVQPQRFIDIAKKKLYGLEDKVVAVLGLAFKPNTDDIRLAPAISIIAQLLAEGAIVKAYDPQAIPRAKGVFGDNVEFCDSVSDAITDSDCVLIVTEWDEFKDEKLYEGKLVIDGRRVLNPTTAALICEYEGICW